MIPSSYLRIYQPLDTFPPDERQRWTSYVEAGPHPPPTTVYAQAAFDGGGHTGAIFPLSPEHAYLRKEGGIWLVCPWRVRMRVLAGLLTFRSTLPAEVAEVFVPRGEAGRAASELRKLREEHPGIQCNITAAAWHVPLRWFVAFDDAERRLLRERGRRRLTYETDLGSARTRVQRGLEILREARMGPGVVGRVAELAAWIELFPAECLVELDYGTVGNLMSGDDVANDRSAGEIWACLESLEIGDFEESRRRYMELASWWGRIRAHESSN